MRSRGNLSRARLRADGGSARRGTRLQVPGAAGWEGTESTGPLGQSRYYVSQPLVSCLIPKIGIRIHRS